jgi:DNA-binding SARP family transcriptional activator/TolB-like protein
MVELRLLGSFEITDAQRRPTASSVLAQPKRAALLAYLAIATPHGFRRRDRLLALFWPEADAAHARHALNQAIHHLRNGLGSEVIVTRGSEEVALDDARFRCDVTTMRDCLASGRLDEALAIYRAELLPGLHVDASAEFDEWLERERRGLHDSAVRAAISLATRSERECNLPTALIWSRRACALAPSDEACSRQLIRLLIRDGNRAAAHAEFQRLATRLDREFEVAPSPQTAAALDAEETIDLRQTEYALAPTDHSPTRAPNVSAASATAANVASWRGRTLHGATAAVVLVSVAAALWRARPPLAESAQSIAIAPFSVPTGDTALVRLGQNLVTTIGANMDHVGEIRVADGIAMLSQAKPKGNLLSSGDAIALARKLGARSVVHGVLVTQGKSVRADAVLYDASRDGAQLARVTATVSTDSLSALTDSITWALLRAVWGRGRAPTPSVAAITTRNPVAMREFLDGERLLAHNSLREAAAAYKRAAEADTTFAFAHYRYWGACAWMGLRSDSTIGARMHRHASELPERERSLVAAANMTTVTQRLDAHRRLAERYPDYADAWVALGDYLMHVAIVTRRDPKEALSAWQQAVRLRPEEEGVAEHLVYACLLADDACARSAFAHYDSLVRADTSSGSRSQGHRRLTLALAAPDKSLTDSLIALALRDSLLAIGYGPMRLPLMRAAIQRPHLLSEWDTIRREDERRRGLRITAARFVDRAARGDWRAVDSAIEIQHRLAVFDAQPLRAVRLRAIAELQGLLPPDARTANAAMAVPPTPPYGEYAPAREMFGDGEANTIVESTWIAGLNALLRADSVAYRRRLAALASDTTAAAAIAVRSLRAIRLGRSGNHAAAAESLLTLERRHGENRPKVWGAFAADRLVAAQWLTEERRFAPADSLLRFTDGFPLGGMFEAAQVIFAIAMLQESRIAEGLGAAGDAVRFASIFIAAYDLAPASQQSLIEEARSRIARLRPRVRGPAPG